MHGRVLIVAGSDSGGGAGLQADVKTVTALGGYAMTAVTALTAQNTLGVFGIHAVPPEFIARQMEVVLTDLGSDAIKTGMLHSRAVVDAVVLALEAHAPRVPLVVDPVMFAKGGAALLERTAQDALGPLLARATVVTPNVPEAEALTGLRIEDLAGLRAAARSLAGTGAANVLVKGGHLAGSRVFDVLRTHEGEELVFESARIETRHSHGTGCTLASAVATGLAQGLPLASAVERARLYLQEALRTAPGYGAGHGPLDHGHPLRLAQEKSPFDNR